MLLFGTCMPVLNDDQNEQIDPQFCELLVTRDDVRPRVGVTSVGSSVNLHMNVRLQSSSSDE
jgi:hypothetical protein